MTPITIASLMLTAFNNYRNGTYGAPARVTIGNDVIACYVEEANHRQRKLGHKCFRTAFYLNGKRTARNVVQNVLIGHELDSE